MNQTVTGTQPPSAGYIPGCVNLASIGARTPIVNKIDRKNEVRRGWSIHEIRSSGFGCLQAAIVTAKDRQGEGEPSGDLSSIASLVVSKLLSLAVFVANIGQDPKATSSEWNYGQVVVQKIGILTRGLADCLRRREP